MGFTRNTRCNSGDSANHHNVCMNLEFHDLQMTDKFENDSTDVKSCSVSLRDYQGEHRYQESLTEHDAHCSRKACQRGSFQHISLSGQKRLSCSSVLEVNEQRRGFFRNKLNSRSGTFQSNSWKPERFVINSNGKAKWLNESPPSHLLSLLIIEANRCGCLPLSDSNANAEVFTECKDAQNVSGRDAEYKYKCDVEVDELLCDGVGKDLSEDNICLILPPEGEDQPGVSSAGYISSDLGRSDAPRTSQQHFTSRQKRRLCFNMCRRRQYALKNLFSQFALRKDLVFRRHVASNDEPYQTSSPLTPFQIPLGDSCNGIRSKFDLFNLTDQVLYDADASDDSQQANSTECSNGPAHVKKNEQLSNSLTHRKTLMWPENSFNGFSKMEDMIFDLKNQKAVKVALRDGCYFSSLPVRPVAAWKEYMLIKKLNFILRHGAPLLSLPVREDGFVRVTELLNLPCMNNTTFGDIAAAVATNLKCRYDLVYDESEQETNEYILRYGFLNAAPNSCIDISHCQERKDGDRGRMKSASTDGKDVSLCYRQICTCLCVTSFSEGVSSTSCSAGEPNRCKYTLSGKWLLRANQGHTIRFIRSDLFLQEIKSPEELRVCIHGTFLKNWKAIRRLGLHRMHRNHIHFASGFPSDTTVISGMRRSSEIAIFLNVEKCMKDGIRFYQSRNGVILSEGLNGFIPPRFFEKVITVKDGLLLFEDGQDKEDSSVAEFVKQLESLSELEIFKQQLRGGARVLENFSYCSALHELIKANGNDLNTHNGN